MVTSWVKATVHHWWNTSISRWCCRSRGQCSPRPSIKIMASSPWSSDSRHMVPVSSGRVKSGSTAPGVSPLLMTVSLALVGPDAGDGEPNPVDAGQCGDVERAGVLIAPREVVRALGKPEGAQVVAAGREQPDAGRPAHVEVAGRVDLEPVDGVLTLGAGHVEELLGGGHRPGAVEGVTHNDLAIGVPVTDVEVTFVRGQRDAVRPGQFRGDERDRAVADPEDPAERQFLLRIGERGGQSERRVGEVQGPV